MVGIYTAEDLREADEGGAVGGAGLPTLEEEEKADEACAPLPSPSITSTASSTSPLLKTSAIDAHETVSGKAAATRDEATVDSQQRSREDLDEFDETIEGFQFLLSVSILRQVAVYYKFLCEVKIV